MSGFISRAQAQRILGCNKDTMVNLLRSGEIDSSRKENGGWLVSYDSLKQYMEKRTERIENIAELQRVIAAYKEENRKLKEILDENGIDYQGELVDVPATNPEVAIIDLNLPKRVLVAFDRNHIHSISQLCNMTVLELKSFDGIGRKAVELIQTSLNNYGLHLRENEIVIVK